MGEPATPTPNVAAPERAVLEAAHCWEPGTDVVPGDEATTAFKRMARLHQARWRESRGWPVGTSPYNPDSAVKLGGKPKRAPRPVGSRLEYGFATRTHENLLSPAARSAAVARLAERQPHQMLNESRLWCDLLSSMPLCFNLFGPLAHDRDLARRVAPAWFPGVPGGVEQVDLEWSPGRLDPRYLGHRTAFDAAVLLDIDGQRGVIGVEAKYHEHLKTEQRSSPGRLDRYLRVADESGAFLPGAVDDLVGHPLQQIWQDHLLALSMTLSGNPWSWSRFVLVYPARNPSFAAGVEDYAGMLARPDTFAAVTIEDLIDAGGTLPNSLRESLRERYVW